jgi:hypothetical protein
MNADSGAFKPGLSAANEPGLQRNSKRAGRVDRNFTDILQNLDNAMHITLIDLFYKGP